MTTMAAVECGFFLGFSPSLGFGETSNKLDEMFEDFFEHRDQSLFLGWRRELKNSVAEVTQEASEHGWDGYDAEPVTDLAYLTARRFIDLLAESALLPDVVPAPDGEIAFEWDHSSNCFFTVTTNQGLLVYAGIFGHDRKQYGQEPLGVELPQTIAKILGSYFPKV